MEEHELRSMASQLSCPEGAVGIQFGDKMNELNHFITTKTIEKLSSKQGESIVEIGPGNGLLSLPIVEALGVNGYYLGIEMSEVMAVQARLALSKKECPVEVVCGDCLNVCIKTESVDGVMAVNVLYFIEDLMVFFRRILSWMKPGGRAVFGIRSDDTLNKIPFTQYGFNIRSTAEVILLMEKAGFISTQSFTYEEGTTLFEDHMVSVDSVIIVGKKP